MNLCSRRVLAVTIAFGFACSSSENADSAMSSQLPEVSIESEQPASTRDGGDSIQRPAIPVAQTFEDLCRSVAFAPVTVSPVLDSASRRELLRYLAENDPVQRETEADIDELRVWVCVDEVGRVQNTDIAKSSGSPEIDAFAEAALARLSFTPAEFEGQRVPAWISLPVVLGPG